MTVKYNPPINVTEIRDEFGPDDPKPYTLGHYRPGTFTGYVVKKTRHYKYPPPRDPAFIPWEGGLSLSNFLYASKKISVYMGETPYFYDSNGTADTTTFGTTPIPADNNFHRRLSNNYLEISTIDKRETSSILRLQDLKIYALPGFSTIPAWYSYDPILSSEITNIGISLYEVKKNALGQDQLVLQQSYTSPHVVSHKSGQTYQYTLIELPGPYTNLIGYNKVYRVYYTADFRIALTQWGDYRSDSDTNGKNFSMTSSRRVSAYIDYS